jgi:hypothetical protein
MMQLHGTGGGKRNPGVVQKESLISLALFGYGNKAVHSNHEFIRLFEGFQDTLKEIMPVDIGFRRMEVRMPEVVLVTDSGEFALDAMSGGINALFGIAWQIYIFGADKSECTVTIDEPENHLHPSMQRAILPSLARAFPNFRFVVSSHSPFIVTSFDQASVYGLAYTKAGGIVSNRLDSKELSGTLNRVLREVLDVESNLPLWVESRINEVLTESAGLAPTERAQMVMSELRRLGISDAIADYEVGR